MVVPALTLDQALVNHSHREIIPGENPDDSPNSTPSDSPVDSVDHTQYHPLSSESRMLPYHNHDISDISLPSPRKKLHGLIHPKML